MSKNIVKKQHYVPRPYLRRFSERHDNVSSRPNDKKNKLIVYNKESKSFYYSNVHNAGSANYFYNIESAPSIEEKQAIETSLSSMESEASKLIKKLILCCCTEKNLFKARIINQNEREELSFYIALQLVRTEKYREIIENNTNGFLSKMKYFVDKHHEINNTTPIGAYDYKINSKNFHLSILSDIDYIVQMSKFITDSCWIFYKNTTDIPYVTSDNPVCRIPRIFESEKLLVNDNGIIVSDSGLTLTDFFTDHLEILFPLTPNICLSIIKPNTPSYDIYKNYRNKCIPVNDDKMINEANKMQFLMSNKRLFTCPQNKQVLEDIIKLNIPKIKIF